MLSHMSNPNIKKKRIYTFQAHPPSLVGAQWLLFGDEFSISGVGVRTMLASPWLCSRGRVLNNGLVKDHPDLVIE
jgi:hypothetical protein